MVIETRFPLDMPKQIRWASFTILFTLSGLNAEELIL